MEKISPSALTSEALGAEKFLSELPEFYDLKNTPEKNPWHDETTLEHTLAIMQAFEKWSDNLHDSALRDYMGAAIDSHSRFELMRLVVLLHDIGKASTIQTAEDGTTSFPGHETKSFELAPPLLDRFDITDSEKEYVLALIRDHGRPHAALAPSEIMVEEIKKVKTEYPEIWRELFLFAMLDTQGSKLSQKNPEEYVRRMNLYDSILSNNKQ